MTTEKNPNPHCRLKTVRANLDLFDEDAIDMRWSTRVLYAQMKLRRILKCDAVTPLAHSMGWPWHRMMAHYED